MSDRKQKLRDTLTQVLNSAPAVDEHCVRGIVEDLMKQIELLYPEVDPEYVPEDEEMAFYRLAAARAERLQAENSEMRKKLLMGTKMIGDPQ